MKKSFALAFLFFLYYFSAQNITDYEYIYVPKKFKDFKTNEYNLNTLLKKALEGKKYKVIQDEHCKLAFGIKTKSLQSFKCRFT